MKSNGLLIKDEVPQPLTEKELIAYFKRMRLGDQTARNEIINHNIRIVTGIVSEKYRNTLYESEELAAVGMVGLIKSVDTFDIDRKVNFVTYAYPLINREILMYIGKNKRYTASTVSIDYSYDDELTIGDTIIDPVTDLEFEYENKELYKEVRKIVSQLPEIDKMIITKYFGFKNNQSVTQQEIASELNTTQANISRNISRILQKIKIELKRLELMETTGTSRR